MLLCSLTAIQGSNKFIRQLGRDQVYLHSARRPKFGLFCANGGPRVHPSPFVPNLVENYPVYGASPAYCNVTLIKSNNILTSSLKIWDFSSRDGGNNE